MTQREINRRKYSWLDKLYTDGNQEGSKLIVDKVYDIGMCKSVGITPIKRIYTFLTGSKDYEHFIDRLKQSFEEDTHTDEKGNFKLTPTEFMEYLKANPEFSEELYDNNLVEYRRLYNASKEFKCITALKGDYL